MFNSNRIASCPLARAARGVVICSPDVFDEVAHAVAAIETEFCVFLMGACDLESGIARIVDFYVPRQKVTAAYVEASEIFDARRYVGILHSHHSMGAFHSPTDRAGVDNAPVSIVAAVQGWSATTVWRLPCDRVAQITAAVIVTAAAEVEKPVLPAPRAERADPGDCPHAGQPRASCGQPLYTLVQAILARAEPYRLDDIDHEMAAAHLYLPELRKRGPGKKGA